MAAVPIEIVEKYVYPSYPALDHMLFEQHFASGDPNYNRVISSLISPTYNHTIDFVGTKGNYLADLELPKANSSANISQWEIFSMISANDTKPLISNSLKLKLVQIESVVRVSHKEDEDAPSILSVNLSKEILYRSEPNNYPERITAHIDGGICFQYINKDFRLFLDIYNDGTLGSISENFRKGLIIENIDITSIQEAIRVINKFKGNELPKKSA